MPVQHGCDDLVIEEYGTDRPILLPTEAASCFCFGESEPFSANECATV
ncbi:hypothetical protein ABH931_005733 [Streptacidiphilus sp. MAP12-33]